MRELKVIVAITIFATFIAGCSDQPDSGIIKFRYTGEFVGGGDEIISVKGVTGNVYSYSPDFLKAYSNRMNDQGQLEDFERQVLEHFLYNEKRPELTLRYNGVSESELKSTVPLVFAKAQKEYRKGMFSRNSDRETLAYSLGTNYINFFEGPKEFQDAKNNYIKSIDMHFFKNHFETESKIKTDTKNGEIIGAFSNLPSDKKLFLVVWEVEYLRDGKYITARYDKYIRPQDDYYKEKEIDVIELTTFIGDDSKNHINSRSNDEMASFMMESLDRTIEEARKFRDKEIRWNRLMSDLDELKLIFEEQ